MVGRIGIVRKQTDLRESISSGMLALNIQLLSGDCHIIYVGLDMLRKALDCAVYYGTKN